MPALARPPTPIYHGRDGFIFDWRSHHSVGQPPGASSDERRERGARDEVWRRDRKFREKNPDYRPNMPCVYVGQTSLDPEKRFKQHKNGYKASCRARKYGVRLLPHLYNDLNPVPAAERLEQEERLARDLQGKGYAVWWN
ncbi:MAG: hypothetical protein F4123_10290 [Gemmatimonadetes bacterium]|nr:hypothetical protein [Gemmatimonadota bacterium]MYB98562.1 hypothetical protein [Gemmatimonadota bacterium]MYI46746.1 hypothetical protein [Gemmatimonadota bacterium]